MRKLVVIAFLFLSGCAHVSKIDFAEIHFKLMMFPQTVVVLGIDAISPTAFHDNKKE